MPTMDNTAIRTAQAAHRETLAFERAAATARAKRDAAIMAAVTTDGVTAYRVARELGLSVQAVAYVIKRERLLPRTLLTTGADL